ncbi:MAG: MmcQ/YjbR family DNA-binding protein [Ignavibacteria bacterium]
MTIREFKKLALSFPNTIEAPHFDRTAFKVIDKRIFATLHEESGKANLKFSEKDQTFFCSLYKKAIYPVPNKWGMQGWTTIELNKISDGIMLDALNTAFKEVFKSKIKK